MTQNGHYWTFEKYGRWNAGIRISENGKALKSELWSVRISARSDFRCLGLNEHAKSVQKPNIQFSEIFRSVLAYKAQFSEIWMISFRFRTYFVQFGPKSPNLMFCPNTEPSENGTKLKRLRTERVRISDVDCTVNVWIPNWFGIQTAVISSIPIHLEIGQSPEFRTAFCTFKCGRIFYSNKPNVIAFILKAKICV